MVDEVVPQVVEPETVAEAGRRGFFSTPTGKAIAIGGGVAAVLFVLAAIGAVLWIFVLNQDADTTIATNPPVPAKAPTAPGKAVSAPKPAVEPGQVALTEVFTFRDVFKPLVTAEDAEAEGEGAGVPGGIDTSGTPGGETSETIEPDTLYLQDVVTEDGVRMAQFTLNSVTYTSGEGDRLGDTPWSVVDIEGDRVVMLYGDDRVSFTVGQGVSK